MKVRTRLAIGNALFVALLMGAGSMAIRWRVRTAMLESVDRELSIRTARFLERPGEARNQGRGRQGPRRTNPYRPHRFDIDARSIDPPGDFPLWDAAAFRKALSGSGGASEVVRDDERLRVSTTPVVEGGAVKSVVQIPYPMTEFDRAQRGLDLALLSLLPFGAVGAAWVGASLTGRVLRPVRRLGAAVSSLDPREPAARLPVEGRDEFAELALTFNGLLERIHAGNARQSRFVADASHELRTPLTVLRATLDNASHPDAAPDRRAEALGRALRTTESMIRLVGDLLYLSRMETPERQRRRDRLRLAEVAEAAAADLPEGGRVAFGACPMDVEVVGDGDELVRLVANLLSNALRNTPVDGTVRVTVGCDGDRALLSVEDTGCGIPPEHLPRLGERFHRVDASRARSAGGTGLGVAISKEIAAGHGGGLEFQSTVGRGTTASLWLPRAGGGQAGSTDAA